MQHPVVAQQRLLSGLLALPLEKRGLDIAVFQAPLKGGTSLAEQVPGMFGESRSLGPE